MNYLFCILRNVLLWTGMLWTDWPPKLCWDDWPIRYVKLFTEHSIYAQNREDCQEWRREDLFLIQLECQKCFVKSSVRQVTTTWGNCRCSLVIHFTEGKFRNEATGVVLWLDLGQQRLLHHPWTLESVSHMGGELGIKFHLCHSGVVVSWKWSATFLNPRVRPSSSSSAYVFVNLG